MLDLDMTPYSAFVWGSYGVTALVLVGLTIQCVLNARRSAKRLAELESQT